MNVATAMAYMIIMAAVIFSFLGFVLGKLNRPPKHNAWEYLAPPELRKRSR